MAYDITLEGKNLIEAEQLLVDITNIFESLNVNYWLEGGTLLGIRRENRLLPWDNDIDISILEEEKSKIPVLLKTLSKSGFRIRTRTFSAGHSVFQEGNLRMIKIRNKRFFGLLKGKVCLDIFIKYTIDQKSYWQIGDKTKNVPFKFYKNLTTVLFKNKSYTIPKLTDEYLTYRYGEWQTPVKTWDPFKDDNALK